MDTTTNTQTNKRQFILEVIQPGQAGLMDGSVSSLAPLFAAATPVYGNAYVKGRGADRYRRSDRVPGRRPYRAELTLRCEPAVGGGESGDFDFDRARGSRVIHCRICDSTRP